MDDLIDQVNENLYLGFNETAPTSKDVLEVVIKELPDVSDDIKQDFVFLYDLIEKCLSVIEIIEDEYELPQLNALLDTIADAMQKRKGLIWRRIQ